LVSGFTYTHLFLGAVVKNLTVAENLAVVKMVVVGQFWVAEDFGQVE
jgi:hypothetical protein